MPFEWSKAVESLRTLLGQEVAGRWIEPLRVVSVSDRSIILEAPNAFFREWIIAHYTAPIQDSVGGRQLEIVAASQAASRGRGSGSRQDPSLGESDKPVAAGERLAGLEALPGSSRAGGGQRAGGLNPKFTFDRFVVGPSNRFAHAASLAVAESPAKAYNPLFIYGGVGLGKTHLMQAIGHAVTKHLPAARVCYISSEQFTNELITAIQTRAMSRFRDRYRTVSALLIDDIHFIAGKESTQEEFFHTFNALHDANKQIVVSSDRPPNDIDRLEERLVSRFEWGLVTDIQPPDFETRAAILRKKAEEASTEVPGAVVEFIAKQVTSNIRELEGALIRVVAYSRFFSKPLSAEVAQEVLKDMLREVESRLTVEVIQRRVAEHFRLSPEELRSARRQRSILYPRQLAMYLCRTLTDSSFPEIGRAFGGRDHTTALHAVEKIEREIAQDGHKKRLVDSLVKIVTTQNH